MLGRKLSEIAPIALKRIELKLKETRALELKRKPLAAPLLDKAENIPYSSSTL
jgi:hypothetical protein